jgi:hypothetical protein
MTPPPSSATRPNATIAARATTASAQAATAARLRRQAERAAAAEAKAAGELPAGEAPLPEASEPETPASGLRPDAAPSRLLSDLVRAMQATAREALDSAIAQYAAEATELLDALRDGSGERAHELRAAAEREAAEIAAWSRAEQERIREETDRRIAELGSRLDADLERERSETSARGVAVRDLVERYRAELDAFHGGLQATSDPATFAALAAAMPGPPSFEAIAPTELASLPARRAKSTAPVTDFPTEPSPAGNPAETPDAAPDPRLSALGIALRARRAAEAELAQASTPAVEPAVEVVAAEAEAAEAVVEELAPEAIGEPAVAAPDAVAEPVVTEEPAISEAPTHEPEIATAPTPVVEASPVAPEPGERQATVATTRLVVEGLVSLAGIASFKKEIARRPGIQSLAVTSDPSGEFIFTVVHGRSVDLATVVTGIANYSAAVTGTSRGELRIGVVDPEAS